MFVFVLAFPPQFIVVVSHNSGAFCTKVAGFPALWLIPLIITLEKFTNILHIWMLYITLFMWKHLHFVINPLFKMQIDYHYFVSLFWKTTIAVWKVLIIESKLRPGMGVLGKGWRIHETNWLPFDLVIGDDKGTL